jgi:hypothetical protein
MQAHAMEYVAQAGQAAHEQLPCPEELTTTEERTKFKQARFQQWLKQQRHELKTGEASKVLAELSRLQTLMQESHVESAVETITKKLAYVRERQAMLMYATFQAQDYPIGSGSAGGWGECQQTRGAKPYERSRDALGTSACQRHTRAAQSGL